jgi:biopolymer transport protein ExbB
MLYTLTFLLLAQVGEPSIDKLLGDEPAKTPAPAAAPMNPTPAPMDSAATPTPAAKTDAAKPDDAAKAPAVAAESSDKKEAEKKVEEESWLSGMLKSGALGYMYEGGIFMWPILILGILALGVIIERFRVLMMLNTRAEALRTRVRQLLETDQVEEALNLCDREQGPVPAILGAGLRKYLVAQRLGYDPAKIEEQVVKGMDDYSIHIVAAMEKHLPVLATVSSAAPMIGFLGTVQGMVLSFANIVAQHGKEDIVMSAASGIMVSLLTTVLGLIVGIPAFIFFNYFTSVINRFVLDVEESAAELIEAVTFQLAMAGKNGQVADVGQASSPAVAKH